MALLHVGAGCRARGQQCLPHPLSPSRSMRRARGTTEENQRVGGFKGVGGVQEVSAFATAIALTAFAAWVPQATTRIHSSLLHSA